MLEVTKCPLTHDLVHGNSNVFIYRTYLYTVHDGWQFFFGGGEIWRQLVKQKRPVVQTTKCPLNATSFNAPWFFQIASVQELTGMAIATYKNIGRARAANVLGMDLAHFYS